MCALQIKLLLLSLLLKVAGSVRIPDLAVTILFVHSPTPGLLESAKCPNSRPLVCLDVWGENWSCGQSGALACR
jgi:hypothetical protein